MDHQDQLVSEEIPEIQDLLVRQEVQDNQAHQAHQDQQDLQVPVETEVLKGKLDQQVPQVHLALMVNLVHQDQ